MSKPLPAESARKLVPNAVSGRLGVSRQRMNQLLNAGRVRGAYREGATWLIPQPVRIRGVK